jgi:glycosyltransferase involved in cell wall biosynthesis
LTTAAQVIFEKYWSFNRGYRDIDYDSDYFRRHLKRGVPIWEVGAGANMAFRRAALESTGGFDTRLDVGAAGCSGDSEMWYRLIAGGWTVHYTPRAIAYHTHRKDINALKRQIYYYLRGNTSSLLVQYQRTRHRGNLRHLFGTLPTYYFKSLLRRIRYFNTTKYDTLFHEISGSFAGIAYFARHRRGPVAGPRTAGPLGLPAKDTVSVVITTYNHGRYIAQAIDSVRQQTHPAFEVIVVDDGSTDDTGQILSRYPEIRYLRQDNRGLASARNLGALQSHGNYLVFLDADDLLYPQAIAKNLRYFSLHPDCAFISGWHDKIDAQKRLLDTYERPMPQEAHYLALLRGNYIGMHGTVMYQRRVFDAFLFDETLPACEDYDLYLRLAKTYPVFSHNEKLAAYRMHAGNMSGNVPRMWRQVRAVLRKNADLSDQEVKRNYRQGIRNWSTYYSRELYRRIAYRYLYSGYRPTANDWIFVTARMPRRMISLFMQKLIHLYRKKPQRPPKPGAVRFGHLRRTLPLSKEFGYDRGGPIDRYYIEAFLKENGEYIHGNVLEIGDNAYTLAYGGERVTKSDVLFIDASNPQATIIGDLSTADHIPADQFDCIILTQTLHLIYDFQSAIRHCHRILKPGGALLLTVPGITQIDYGQWGDTWYWSFTGRAIQKLLAGYFGAEHLFVQTHGNVLAATAFLYGLGQDEISRGEKEENDPHYQVIITARAVKKEVIN